MELRAGFRFVPSDEDLVTYLTEKVYGGREARSDRVVLGECDMYGDKEPWNIWNDHGGLKLNVKAGEDLYLFAKLKKVSVNGFRNHNRQVGSGTWSGANSIEVAGGVAKKKHFSYENKGCREHHGEWIMHEYSLVDSSVGEYVLCRLRRKINKKINKKKSKLMSTSQTKNLPHANDQEIMIKKQRLGVESHQDPITVHALNLVGDQQYINLGSKTNNTEQLSDNDDVINMQDHMQVATISSPSFDYVCDFSELFGSDSDQQVKEISLDDEFGSIVGAKPDDDEDMKEISFQEFNLSVVKSSSTSGELLENFAEELQNILEIDDDHGNNDVAESSSSTGGPGDQIFVSENDHALQSFKSSSTSGLENFTEELQHILEIDDDHGNNNVRESSSSNGGPGDQIFVSENDHALQSLFESHEELEELEKLTLAVSYSQLNLFSEEEVMNGIIMDIDDDHAKSTAGAHLSHQMDDYQAEDEEYLSGKSYAEQLKDVPLYYEAHDHEDVFMDTLHFLDL